MIKKLDWDSGFFGFEVGQIIENNNIEGSNYKLLVLNQTIDNKISVDNFDNSFTETKIIFSKKLLPFVETNSILDTDFNPLLPTDLYNLAYESGKQSRFNLDKNFTKKQFENLYKKWIDNSLNKQFASKVFYTKKDFEITGFVTIKIHQDFATIGLIAVAANQQGQGIGQKLLQKTEHFCIENNISELRIPTQKSNEQACRFYTKNNYQILEETIVKHYWKR